MFEGWQVLCYWEKEARGVHGTERHLEILKNNDQEQPLGQRTITAEVISWLMGILLVTESRIHTLGKTSKEGCILMKNKSRNGGGGG